MLTISQDNAIIANHNQACFKIVNHFLYFVSSHEAVSIWNHPRKQIANAINDNNPNTRLIKFLIVNIKLSFCRLSVLFPGLYCVSCGTFHSPLFSNPCPFTNPRLPAHTNEIAHKLNKTFLNVFFIFLILICKSKK